MILIVGATGRLGGDITRRLVALGRPVRALVRPSSDGEKVGKLAALGVECCTGDLRDPASLAAACQGVEVVISTATAISRPEAAEALEATDGQGQLNLVEAARAAGVRHFIYVSFSGGVDQSPTPAPFTAAKRAAEQAVVASGIPYTILRPSVFMETWLSPGTGFDYLNGKAVLFGNGDCPISWISLYDVSRFALAAVDYPSARNRVLDLGGPQALTQREVVSIFEGLSGKTFQLEVITEQAMEARRAAAKNAAEVSSAALQLALARGDAIDMEPVLQDFPLPLTPVRDYALRVLGDVRERLHGSEIIRQLRELVDYLVDAIGSGQYGFDPAMYRYIEHTNNELSRSFADFPRRMGEIDPDQDQDYVLSQNVRRDVLRGVARQFDLPEVTRFTEALIKSQDERISLYHTLTTQAELLRSA